MTFNLHAMLNHTVHRATLCVYEVFSLLKRSRDTLSGICLCVDTNTLKPTRAPAAQTHTAPQAQSLKTDLDMATGS